MLKYKFSAHVIALDRRGTFSVANGFGENVIIFGVDVNSSVHVDSKEKRYFNSLRRSHTRIR